MNKREQLDWILSSIKSLKSTELIFEDGERYQWINIDNNEYQFFKEGDKPENYERKLLSARDFLSNLSDLAMR